jgi:hypothetical protein
MGVDCGQWKHNKITITAAEIKHITAKYTWMTCVRHALGSRVQTREDNDFFAGDKNP